MNDFVSQLERELLRVAPRSAAAPERRRPGRRPDLGLVVATLSVLVALAIAGGAVLALRNRPATSAGSVSAVSTSARVATAVPRRHVATAVPRRHVATAVPRRHVATAVPRRHVATAVPRRHVATAVPSTHVVTVVPPATPAVPPGAKLERQVNLTAPAGGSGTAGLAQLFRLRSGAQFVLVRASGLVPNSPHNAYGMWLTGAGSAQPVHFLGFVARRVTRTGTTTAGVQLPTDLSGYRRLLIALQSTQHPTAPGVVVLEGHLR